MIKTTETEFYKKDKPLFTSGIQGPKGEAGPEHTPIEGYILNKNVSCLNCKYFVPSKERMMNEWPTLEECSHKENINVSYTYKGKHETPAWEPQMKNKRLDCELFEKKIPIMQKIKIRLGIMNDN